MSDTEQKVLQCIDIVLDKLGKDVRRAFFFHLRREKDVKRYEIFHNPSKFIIELHSIFGDASKKIEDDILHTIENELKLIHNEEKNLLEFLVDLKEKIDSEVKKEVVENVDEDKDLTYMQYSRHSGNEK